VAIVQAAREQSTGLQEINTAVIQMDQGTQQNAAMVEETNAASHTLVNEVTSLSGRLGQFNLGGGARTIRPVSQSTSRPAPAPASHAARPAIHSAPRAVAAANARPMPSPARALGGKLAAAFNAAPAAAPSGGDWEEF
jgi:methyl-accepting chemotaxis protein/methyl-accepting chemotaxis protein-1 (serine sensor receptor)